jgi:hypothetical protein
MQTAMWKVRIRLEPDRQPLVITDVRSHFGTAYRQFDYLTDGQPVKELLAIHLDGAEKVFSQQLSLSGIKA